MQPILACTLKNLIYWEGRPFAVCGTILTDLNLQTPDSGGYAMLTRRGFLGFRDGGYLFASQP